VKTAIIDVSIDRCAIRQSKGVTEFYTVHGNSITNLILSEQAEREDSHGGLCLKYYADGAKENAEYFILLPNDENGKCSVDDLIIAFDWCIMKQVRMISLSAGTKQYKDAIKLWGAVQRLYDAKVLLIASGDNDGQLSYPSCFDFCIGVSLDRNSIIKPGHFAYMADTHDGINVLYHPDIDVSKSNSYTTAYFAGMLAKYSSTDQNDVRKWLMENSVDNRPLRSYQYLSSLIGEKYYDDVIIVAVQGMSKSFTENYQRRFKKLFIDNGYYCLSVNVNGKNEPQLYQHSLPDNTECNYVEYVQLMINICHPNIVLIDCDAYNSLELIDVLLYLEDSRYVCKTDALEINMIQTSPVEAFNVIVSSFA